MTTDLVTYLRYQPSSGECGVQQGAASADRGRPRRLREAVLLQIESRLSSEGCLINRSPRPVPIPIFRRHARFAASRLLWRK